MAFRPILMTKLMLRSHRAPLTRTPAAAGLTYGESASGKGPQTYGPVESRDFAGAVQYLGARADVDGGRIGAIGTSAGGNIVLYGVPDAQPVKAVLAIQPTRLTSFNTNFARTELGPLGPALMKPVDLL